MIFLLRGCKSCEISIDAAFFDSAGWVTNGSSSFATPGTEAAPGHGQTGPDQKAAAEGSQTGDGLAEKPKGLTGMKTSKPAPSFLPALFSE